MKWPTGTYGLFMPDEQLPCARERFSPEQVRRINRMMSELSMPGRWKPCAENQRLSSRNDDDVRVPFQEAPNPIKVTGQFTLGRRHKEP